MCPAHHLELGCADRRPVFRKEPLCPQLGDTGGNRLGYEKWGRSGFKYLSFIYITPACRTFYSPKWKQTWRWPVAGALSHVCCFLSPRGGWLSALAGDPCSQARETEGAEEAVVCSSEI